jgi:PAS domain S-box-containing protein
MSLRQRTFVVVGLAILGLLVAVSLIVSSQVLGRFSAFETASVTRDAERARQVLKAELDNLDVLVSDWAEWDDAYEFVADANPEFVRSNLNVETFRALRAAFLAFVASDGRVVWGRRFDAAAGDLAPLPPDLEGHLRAGSPLVARSEASRTLVGIIMLHGSPVAIASRAILTSGARGPCRGAVIIARDLDRDTFRRLGAIVSLSIEARTVGDRLPDDFAAALAACSAGTPVAVRVLDASRVAGYALLRDLYGEPALVVRVDEPRTVYRDGMTAARYLVGLLVGSVLFFAVLIVVGLERTVLARLGRLSADLNAIAGSGDPSGRVAVDSDDELSRLARDINSSLGAVELAGQALRDSEERYRRLVELSPDGILIHSGGTVVFSNRRMAEILGYASPDALVGRTVIELVHEDYRGLVKERIARVTGGLTEVPTVEEKLLRADGSAVAVEVAAIPFGSPAQPTVQVVVRDISARKHLEAQVRHAQKLEAIGQLAGGLAHDFNNLLQAILGGLEVLRVRGAAHESFDDAIAELETHVGRGAALARQLLLFSRREVTKAERLDLNRVIEHALGLLQRVVRESIKVQTDLAPQPLPIIADRGQIEQVIVNLAMNASDAMPEGGVLKVGSGGDAEGVWLEVTDTGVGMAEDVQARIFEPFFTTKDLSKGTGLGLAVVHGIVTQHRGRVDVRSAVGKGTTFRVTLPGALSASPEALAAPASRERQLPGGGGERILVVEDEDGARESLLEMLTLLGYRAIGVDSGEEAGIIPAEPGFDVLLTDLVLPGIHGFDLAAGLKARWPSLRVIVMSGYDQDEALHGVVRAGAIRFLQKPFDLSTLAREIQAALRDDA